MALTAAAALSSFGCFIDDQQKKRRKERARVQQLAIETLEGEGGIVR